MADKLTRTRKREIRAQVRAIVVRKLQQLNMCAFKEDPTDLEIEYANRVLAETITCMQPPGLTRLQAILREQGVPEHHVVERSQILWDREQRGEV